MILNAIGYIDLENKGNQKKFSKLDIKLAVNL